MRAKLEYQWVKRDRLEDDEVVLLIFSLDEESSRSHRSEQATMRTYRLAWTGHIDKISEGFTRRFM